MKILLTGFEPFGKSTVNPSQKLMEALPDKTLNNVKLLKAVLPVDHQDAPEILLELRSLHHPDAVLLFGLASGRSKIAIERIAVNLLDFQIPDNTGTTLMDQPVIKNAPAAYFSTLPIRAMLSSLKNNGIPAELSLSAGTYLCNQVFFTLMHDIAHHPPAIPAGFIHLPALPEQAAESEKSVASMSLDQIIKAANNLITQLEHSMESASYQGD
jgi:pyroglutamyl-peptidase